MSASYAIRDSATMLRRNVLHLIRYPSLTVFLVLSPLIFLLLFVYVFGGTMGAGLPGGDGRQDYLRFITPGILMIAVTSVSVNAAISVATDMEKGIIDRFRTMAISKASVLTGHVLGSLLQVAFVSVVILAVAAALGYRTDGGAGGWVAGFGLLLVLGFGMTWLGVAMGLVAPNTEAASNMPFPLILLPFLSSGFTPTDSLPAGLRHFAEHQPFTPIIDAFRALIGGTSPGSDLWLAFAWCGAFAVVGYLWSRRQYAKVRAS